jgi:hypothetical protein
MQGFFPAQDTILIAAMTARVGNTPIIAGVVTFYLVPQNGDHAGSWWKASDGTWSATEISSGSGTHIGDGAWSCTIDADAWEANTRYTVYAKESGDLHLPWHDVVLPVGSASDGTVTTTPAQGVTEICNYAIALVGSMAGSNTPYLETFDGNPSDPTSELAKGWAQRLYPFARDYAQIKLQPPECLRYPAPGAALASPSALGSTGWGYLYSRPSGCLLFLGVVLEDYHDEANGNDVTEPYREIGDQIACDLNDGILFKHIVRMDDCTKFSEGLKEVTAHRLAYLIARPLGGDAKCRQELLQEFDLALDDARSMTGQRSYDSGPGFSVALAHYRHTSRPVKYYTDANGVTQVV